jgi:hypothetical protein
VTVGGNGLDLISYLNVINGNLKVVYCSDILSGPHSCIMIGETGCPSVGRGTNI